MFEESMSIPGIWASMNRWFTPTVLFVLLNVMIGTIAVTSGLGGGTTHRQQQQQQEEDHQEHDQNTEDSNSNTNQHQNQEQNYLARSPSVLQKLKSINFYAYTYRSQEPISMPTPETHTHQQEHHHHIHEPEQQPHRTHEEEEEEVEGEKLTMDEVYGKLHGSHNRTHSDLKPSSGEVLTKLPKKMKKSASAKSAFAHFKEHDIVESRRPATVRELQAPKVIEEAVDEDGDDEEVDAKADDFINRFKKQLKLQRLDSITRYKDMLKRGSAK